MLKTNKTPEELLEEIKDIASKKYFSLKDYHQLRKRFSWLDSIFELEQVNQKNMDMLFEVESSIANSKKQYRQIIEKEVILSFMGYLPIKLFSEKNDAYDNNTKEKAASLLSDFAKKLYAIKIPRDSFSGKRKSCAIQILGSLACYFDVPEFLEIAKKALKNKSTVQFVQVTDSLQKYFKSVKKEPDEEIIKIIDKRCGKAKTKMELMASLQFLVETHVISELEALSRLDEWKEKNDVWY